MVILLAQFLSLLFNPYFLIFPVPYLLIVRQTGDPLLALKWTIFTALFIIAIGVMVYLSVKKGYFSDLDISKREQRPLFFLAVTLCSVLYFFFVNYLQGPLVLVVAMSGIFLSIFVLSIINTYIKASIHVASIAALIFSFSILYNGFFLLLLFLIPLIAWSRLKVHRHTMQEVIAGLLVGIFIPLVVYLVFKVLLQISLSV